MKGHRPVIRIGRLPSVPPRVFRNPIKEALKYRQFLEEDRGRTQAEAARFFGVSRARVTQVLNLLKLDESVLSFVLGLDSTDERLKRVTERRLRPLVQITDHGVQREEFVRMTGVEVEEIA